MKRLAEYKEDIHSCSKCGLCQFVCPIYKITGNDCTVSRGLFIMLKRLINGELRMSKIINNYLDLCLKCGACSKFCPSGIDVVQLIASAKSEYFKSHLLEKLISFIQKWFIFGWGVSILRIFAKNKKSKKFDRKVIYFGGCSGKIKGNAAVVNILNACGVEVITSNFQCCGIPFYVRGDEETYNQYKKSFLEIMEKNNVKEVVTTCASCQKTIRAFSEQITVKNIFEYIKENNLRLKLKQKRKVTFHKPCNIDNFNDIKWILCNTENLEYIEMKDYDSCCGLNGISKIDKYNVMSKIFINKRKNIVDTKTKLVLTSCLGCETALNLYSQARYKVEDFTEFLNKNISSFK